MKRLLSLTFKQLRTLEAVTDAQSLTAAGEMLGLTTPAIHSQLKALEDNFGCPLLYRQGERKFMATPQGDELLAAYRKCHAALQTSVRRIDALNKGLSGTVVLGVVSTGKYFAPRLVAMIKAAFPDIEIVLRVGNRTEVMTWLSEDTIDLAIMGRPPREPLVEATVIGEHPHVLIAAPGHPLCAAQITDPKEILKYPIILREEGSGTRIMAIRFLDRIGEGQPYDSLVMDSNETIKQAVIAGLGIAIISRHTVTEEIKTGRLVEVKLRDLPIQRTWFLIHRADSTPSGAARQVMDFINAENGSFLPA